MKPKELVQRWVNLCEAGKRKQAIQEVYEQDVQIEENGTDKISSIIKEASNIFPQLSPTICMSLLTLTIPWKDEIKTVRNKLYNKTYKYLAEKYDEDYAKDSLVGLE